MSVFGPYPGVVRDWHDGDTCHVDIDLGFGVIFSSHNLAGTPLNSARIFGINAPELATLPGKAALAFVRSLCPPGTPVTVISHGWDKYGGRADLSLTLPDGRDVATELLNSGNAVAFP